MKKAGLLVLSFLLMTLKVSADEGMWLLPYLNKLNVKAMKSKGLKLKVEDIYSVNQSSLKDAIVIFGGGCTGEVISDQGLVLTNHHCGYGAIQQHSTVEHDYLKNGFWAFSKEEEIPTPGLTVTFIKRIEDVTDRIIPQLTDDMTEKERSDRVAELSKEIVAQADADKPGYHAFVRDFFGGNQYMLFVTQVYSDIRMVGAPPSSIGKFGGDTDNWMWPRHTGDFSLFRIYADKEGNPAAYSPDNVPLKPVKHLTISLAGVKEGDFTMIMGFPGSTKRYMSSYEIDEMLNQSNPNRILIRGIRQDILKQDMQADPKIRIQYASKYAGSSNYWKNSIGMSRGVQRLHVREQKEAIERQFTEWVDADPARRAKYGEALALKRKAVEGRMPIQHVQQYLNEAVVNSIELLKVPVFLSNSGYTQALKEGDETKMQEILSRVEKGLDNFYKDFNAETDRKVAKAMVRLLREKLPAAELPEIMQVIDSCFGGDSDRAVDYMYDRSLFYSPEKIEAFLRNPDYDLLKKDEAYRASVSVHKRLRELSTKLPAEYNEMFNRGHRLFVAGLREMDQSRALYPDANFTIRLTYGQVLPYDPADAVAYDYKTTLKGVMEKEDPDNPYEFTVPEKLKELYIQGDYGQYGSDKELVTCFISNNDITGGNSGSPVLNGKGQLVGTAFDGNWEAMSGDIAFEPALQRTISVDIRYILFLIDKYAGASHLIEEMTIVK